MIKMKRINVMISDEAKEIVDAYKKRTGIRNLDVTVDVLLLIAGEHVPKR